jgi:CBS domain containing-hemolysin-like protein
MSLELAIPLAIALLIGNAFFVGAEFALISARRTQIEPRAAQGSRSARTTLRAMEHVSPMMAGAQLGITACSIGLGAVAKPAVADAAEPVFTAIGLPPAFVDPFAIAVSLIIVVSLHMVLGEMVPKNIALARPARSALILGPPLFAIVTVLRPVIWVLNGAANIILRIMRVPVRDEVATTFTRDEVAGLIEESRRMGLIDEAEHELFTGALDFADVRIGDVAIPVPNLIVAAEQTSPRQLQDLCVQSGYSRFPLQSELGAITGYVHVKDLTAISDVKLDLPVEHRWVRGMPIVQSDARLQAVLSIMQRRGTHMVRVIDPSSQQLIGVAMLQDVLARLVGNVTP